MTDVIVYGAPQSTYVRTARMACHEKGVDHALEPIEFGSPAHLALHPFAKMPAMRHGEVVLYETSAIARYLDLAFAGPPLVPAEALGAARMEQWISAINAYYYPVIARDILLPRFGILEAKEDAIAEAATRMRRQLEIVERTLAANPFLAGSAASLADLFLAPIVFWLKLVPEGEAALPDYGALGRWYDRMAGRASFQATIPPMPGQ
jgi:glutathione S-transferase